MPDPGYSLVTCTYRDAHLVQGLLDEVPAWTLPPRETVVVDDASPEPFAAMSGNVRLLRLEENRGPARAKQAGVDQASSGHVLSADADIRPHPEFAARALEWASAPGIGLVGAPVVYAAGGVGMRHQHLCGSLDADYDNPRFIPGELWMVSKRLWNDLGGYTAHAASTHEDVHFSNLVRSSGLELKVLADFPARCVRRLDRVSTVNRHVRYLAEGFAGAVARHGPHALVGLMEQAARRMGHAVESGDINLAYVDLLKLAALVARAHDVNPRAFCDPRVAPADLKPSLAAFLAPYPRLRRLLDDDLARLRLALPDGGRPTQFWDTVLAVFRPMGSDAVLAWLDRKGADEIEAEEASGYDSHYTEHRD